MTDQEQTTDYGVADCAHNSRPCVAWREPVIEVATQDEFEAAVYKNGCAIRIVGDGRFGVPEHVAPIILIDRQYRPELQLSGIGRARIIVRDEAQPVIELWFQMRPQIRIYDSARVQMDVNNFAQPRIEMYDHSQLQIECSLIDNTECTPSHSPVPLINMHDKSRVECKALLASKPRFKVQDHSELQLWADDMTRPRIIMGPDAKVRVHKGTHCTKIKRPSRR